MTIMTSMTTMTTVRPLLAGALSLVLSSACGNAPPTTATFDSEGWIDTSPPGPPGGRPGVGGGEGDEEGDDDEGDDDGGAFWGLWGPYADGQLSELEGEYFVEDRGQEVCLLFFTTTIRGPAQDCSECTAGWEIELHAPEEEINVGTACQTHAPAQIEGLVLRLGIAADDRLMRDAGDGWREIGEAFVEDGELVLEWEGEGAPGSE